MPARQDQTLQIFLIISIFFSLVCAVLGFLGWRAYSEEISAIRGTRERKTAANKLRSAISRRRTKTFAR